MNEDIKRAFIQLLRTLEWSGSGRLPGPEMQPEPACPVCKISQWQGGHHEGVCALSSLIYELEQPD
ncbi:hypothetical protein KAR91_45650 [Candidatus Pacearchaeota archaeon]|nr:hypothetical protein [Candidatus Pacearchaeota archaeon]